MKSLLRKQMLDKRLSLSAKEVKTKSELIVSKLENMLEFKAAKNILCYVSFNNEVDTIALIKKYLLTKSKSIIVPKVIGNKLALFKINNFSDLALGKFNILEPIKGELFDLTNLTASDIILVPGVAFDLEHNRIGYGKGYFDKLLAKIITMKEKSPKIIALAFELQIVDKINAEQHDIKVDKIITEKRII